jgi:hypothetical protein
MNQQKRSSSEPPRPRPFRSESSPTSYAPTNFTLNQVQPSVPQTLNNADAVTAIDGADERVAGGPSQSRQQAHQGRQTITLADGLYDIYGTSPSRRGIIGEQDVHVQRVLLGYSHDATNDEGYYIPLSCWPDRMRDARTSGVSPILGGKNDLARKKRNHGAWGAHDRRQAEKHERFLFGKSFGASVTS